MSILPSQNLGSSSSSSNLYVQNPNLNHGSNLPQPDSPSHPTHAIQSLRITAPVDMPDRLTAESTAPTPETSGGSSKKVKEDHKLNGKKIPGHQKSGESFQHKGSPGSQQKSRSNHQPTSSGRKSQTVNGNHLLNFHYDPITRNPQSRPNHARKLPKRKPYNKDLFLQANYKFVLLDSGNNRAPESMDPDKMLQWEDIICLKYFTPHPTNCPICLDELLCPQMTSCGHIFCFPCILRYFLMGEEYDHNKHESWKKCPLCFMMISSKDLYTIYIENVKQHCVGDVIEFMLLTRDKDSLTLNAKQKETVKVKQEEEEVYDSFSKFSFTVDVELSVRKAMSELDSWLARAESGLVDDLEKLPYVCAAMEQLEERKKYWKEHNRRDNDGVKNEYFHSGSPPNLNLGIGEVSDVNEAINILNQTADVDESYDGQDETLSSSFDDSKDKKIKGSYDFYQAADGQHLILHPLNMKCLLHHYRTYDNLPQRISGKILQLETITQSEAIRRRYRYLSHFSLTTTFQLCEIDLTGILPATSLSPFEDELKNREKQRKRVARKEQEDKIKAEAAAAATHYVPIPFTHEHSSYDHSPAFSLDDFEALGSSSVTTSSSSSPPGVVVDRRPLFSNVARLGFAAAHDSPAALKLDQTHNSSTASSTGGLGLGLQMGSGTTTASFANIISRAKPPPSSVEGEANKKSEIGKKGKKASRVLLSTSGGRRY